MKILTIFKSRTVWTIIITFLINGITSIRTLMPVGYLFWTDAVLGVLAIYFRANPQATIE